MDDQLKIGKKGEKALLRFKIYSWQDDVTASMTLMVAHFPNGTKKHILVDAGLKFGPDLDPQVNLKRHFDPKIIDFILLTHVHADHIGMLAKLYADGCRAKTYTSHMTDSMAELALNDARRIMTANCCLRGEKIWYDGDDVNNTLKSIEGHTFFHIINLAAGLDIVMIDNGHISGAVSFIIRLSWPGMESVFVNVTGDYKEKSSLKHIRGMKYFYKKGIAKEFGMNRYTPMTLLCESTYGENGERAEIRIRDEHDDLFTNDILKAIRKHKKVIFCPVLSIEKPEQVLMKLKKAQETGLLPGNVEIIVTGRLIHNYRKLIQKYSDYDFLPTKRVFFKRYCTKDGLLEEMFLPRKGKVKIILASSGMCQFGQSVRLLEHYISRKDCHIIFTCYLADGTLGKKIVSAKSGDKVLVEGKECSVKASVSSTSQFSSHATQSELVDLTEKNGNIVSVLLSHGTKKAKSDLREKMIENKPKLRDKVMPLGEGYAAVIGRYGIIKAVPMKEKYNPNEN